MTVLRVIGRTGLDFMTETCEPRAMLAIFLATQLVAPNPQNVARWFSFNDVPQYLIKQDAGLWQVPIRVDVSPDGKILDCRAEVRGDFPALDAHTCALIRKRAKFRPAQIDGSPAHGVYRTTIMYVVADVPWDTSKASLADIVVDVNRMPAGVESPAFIRVAFKVGPSGEMSSCTADETASVQKVINHPTLVPIACDQIATGYRATSAVVGGQSVVSVQNATVRFSASSAKLKPQ